jgi:integrase
MRINGPNVARLALAPGKSDAIFFDDELPRFGVRICAGGKRTWIIQYRTGRKQRRMAIGNVASLGADQARKVARAKLGRVDNGEDPQAEKKTERVRSAHTLGAVAEQYLVHLATLVEQGRHRPRSFQETERYLAKHWKPVHDIPAHLLHRRDIAPVLGKLSKQSPIAANRARAALSALFTWAMREGTVDSNPVVGTNKIQESKRNRVLSNAELVDVWNACQDDDAGRITRLLILTAQRRNEVAGIGDAEIDRERHLWSLPSERTKNGLPHLVPLSADALAILDEARAAQHEGRGLIFGRRAGPFSGWSKAKKEIDARIIEARKGRAGKGKPTPLVKWTLHDIRRTVATRMADSPADGGLGILPHVVEAILNHISGHRSGVAGVYNLAGYMDEKRAALEKWAVYVRALLAPNVVPMRATA